MQSTAPHVSYIRAVGFSRMNYPAGCFATTQSPKAVLSLIFHRGRLDHLIITRETRF